LEKDDQLFPVQCIWWLASIIKFTEILTYYRHYKVFLSEYVVNQVVTPLPQNQLDDQLIPESDIPLLDINDTGPIILSHDTCLINKTISLQTKSIQRNPIMKPRNLNTTRSGRVFKNQQTSIISQTKNKKFKKKGDCDLWNKFDC